MSQIRFRDWAHFRSRDFIAVSVAAKTYDGYRKEVLAFFDWGYGLGYRLDASLSNADQLLCMYLHWLAPVRGKGACATVLSGFVLFFPAVKDRLPACHATLRGIMRAMPVKQHLPVTWQVAVLIAFYQVARGGMRYAAATLLCHHCMLRISECLRLVAGDVFDVGTPLLGGINTGMVLRLGKTKVGRVQSVTVDDPHVQRLLRLLLRHTPRHARLFPFTDNAFRRTMAEASIAFGFGTIFKPHGLRGGGATWHYMRYRDVTATKQRGRWASDSSLRVYLQEAEMAFLSARVPDRVLRFGFILARDLYPMLIAFHNTLTQ